MAAPEQPHREWRALLTAARDGRRQAVYLFAGESFDTGRAVRELLDVLVPEARRAFNLETYEGRTTPLAAVFDSLRMPGFFAGDKVIWVKESGVFVSGEKRSDIAKAMLAAWDDKREQEAAEKLLLLVALAGWDEAALAATRWVAATKTKIKEVFGEGLEERDLAQLDAIQAAAAARELRLAAHRDEGVELAALIEAGLPEAVVLVFTSSAVDARKRVVKLIRDRGGLVDLSAERERSGSLTRGAVDTLIEQAARDHGKRLEPAAREVIARRAGGDTALLAGELEKLCLFVGDAELIREADARAVVLDMAESWVFDLTAALSARDGAKCLRVMRTLFAQGEPPLRLVGMIAREIRLLLVAKECLLGSLSGQWNNNLRFDAFQSRLLSRIDPLTKASFGNTHPFALYRRFQDASRLSLEGLRDGLLQTAELDLQLKSTPHDPQVLVELFVWRWCLPKAARKSAAASSPRRV